MGSPSPAFVSYGLEQASALSHLFPGVVKALGTSRTAGRLGDGRIATSRSCGRFPTARGSVWIQVSAGEGAERESFSDFAGESENAAGGGRRGGTTKALRHEGRHEEEYEEESINVTETQLAYPSHILL